MSEPFLAEIRIVGFNFAPAGWAFCDGQILPINQNQSLYSLLGTTYGGDGETTFALPDMRSRVPLHPGGDENYTIGQRVGEETHTLSANEMPQHNHPVNARQSGVAYDVPTNHVLGGATGTPAPLLKRGEDAPPVKTTQPPEGSAGVPTATKLQWQSVAVNIYGDLVTPTPMNAAMNTNTGGGQAHENMMPYLALHFCIALQGLFPSEN